MSKAGNGLVGSRKVGIVRIVGRARTRGGSFKGRGEGWNGERLERIGKVRGFGGLIVGGGSIARVACGASRGSDLGTED